VPIIRAFILYDKMVRLTRKEKTTTVLGFETGRNTANRDNDREKNMVNYGESSGKVWAWKTACNTVGGLLFCRDEQ